MKGSGLLGAFVLAGTGYGLQSPAESRQELQIEVLSAPVRDYSAQPNLSVDASGNVYLVWSERLPQATPEIKFARFDGRSWSEARVIHSVAGMVSSAADIPSILPLPSGRLVVHWQQSAAGNSRGYGVRIAQSTDAGATWSSPVIPHPGHETGENGFVSLYAASGDSAGIVWLDGRNFANTVPATSRQTMLLAARLSSGGAVSAHSVLDDRTCECCHTSAASTARGPVVVYRDRAGDEIRDISMVQLNGTTWSAPRAVHSDGWYTRSCPVNGPSVAASGNEVGVAWFTAARDSARVLVSFSAENATRFSPPVRVDSGNAMGRVNVVMADARTAWVSWLDRSSQGRGQLRVRRVNANGNMSPIYTIAPNGMPPATGFPRMVFRSGELIMAWPSVAAGGAAPLVRVARISVAGK